MNSKQRQAPVIVLDVFRENIEDTGNKYTPVIKRLKKRKKNGEPVNPLINNP